MAFCMVVGAAWRRVGWPCRAACRALSRAEICRGERGHEQAAADSTASTSVDTNRSSSFAEAFKRFEDVSQPKADVARPSDSFLTLLRNSPFVKAGDPSGKVVEGEIFHTVGDDLYIDFGGKFHCVCPRPPRRTEEYVRGARVRVRLHQLELSSLFLGGRRELSLLEADATLLGLISSPHRARAGR